LPQPLLAPEYGAAYIRRQMLKKIQRATTPAPDKSHIRQRDIAQTNRGTPPEIEPSAAGYSGIIMTMIAVRHRNFMWKRDMVTI
jgi:hypothetical protein